MTSSYSTRQVRTGRLEQEISEELRKKKKCLWASNNWLSVFLVQVRVVLLWRYADKAECKALKE